MGLGCLAQLTVRRPLTGKSSLREGPPGPPRCKDSRLMERRAFPERARAWDRQKSWGVGVRCSGRSTVLRRLRGPLGPEQGRRRVRGRLEHHHHGPSRCLLSRRTGLGPQGAARPCPKTTRPRASVYAEGLRHRSPPVAGWDWLPKDVRMKIATRCGPLTPEPCPLRPSCPPCPPYQLVPRGDGTVVLGVDAHVLVGVGTGQEPGGAKVSRLHLHDQGGRGRVAGLCALLPRVLQRWSPDGSGPGVLGGGRLGGDLGPRLLTRTSSRKSMLCRASKSRRRSSRRAGRLVPTREKKLPAPWGGRGWDSVLEPRRTQKEGLGGH